MQPCEYKTVKVYKYQNMQVKYKSFYAFKDASINMCMYESMQTCRFTNMQVSAMQVLKHVFILV